MPRWSCCGSGRRSARSPATRPGCAAWPTRSLAGWGKWAGKSCRRGSRRRRRSCTRFDRGAPVTLLLYNMYDVMPAADEGWSVPPFTGGILDLPHGRSGVARGAENNKGPLAVMLVALEALLPTLDADLELIIEGEEETGSGALRHYLRDGDVRRSAAA